MENIKEKSLPHNIEAEINLLSSILIDAKIFDELITEQKISSKDFYDERNQIIFLAIEQLKKDSLPIDLITLTEKLKKMNLFEKSGGVYYLSSILDKIPTSANAKYYADIIKKKSMARQLISVSQEILVKSIDPTTEIKNLIDESEKKIFEINQELYSSNISLIRDIITEEFKKIMSNKSRKMGTYSGVPSGFIQLDELTDGFQNSELIVIAARPSIGKTAFALNIAANAAFLGKRVGFFSSEMNKSTLIRRMLCSEAKVSQEKLLKNIYTKQEEDFLVKAAEKLYEVTIVFDDTPNIPILELRSKARKMLKDYNIDLLIIDYLQLLTVGDEISKNTPRHEQIAYISRSLKSLARQLNIPVIALAQLNRNVETRGEDSVPKMSDLKDSGSIEQDADIIIFIHKEKEKDKKDSQNEEEDSMKKSVDIRVITIGKNRNGPQDKFEMLFHKKFTRFESITKDHFIT